MPNPIDFLTKKQIDEIGLSPQELSKVYQPSNGHVTHCRGVEGTSKTLWVAKRVKYLIDTGRYSSYDLSGNLTFKGKYGEGSQVLKGENLLQYLWEVTHKPVRNKIIVIDEADSEFPARAFTNKVQTEISLRLWHTSKLGNSVFLTSHLGNSTDVIMDLASHYKILPSQPNWINDSIDFTVINRLYREVSDWTVYNIIQSMLIYNRQELTEINGEAYPKHKKVKSKNSPEITISQGNLGEEIPSDGLSNF